MEKKKAVIFDIDGTISDLSHRLHYIRPTDGGKPDWNTFYKEIGNDTAKSYCVDLCRAMIGSGICCIFLTARPEKYRLVTDMWLRHVAGVGPFTLYLRKDDDYRKAAISKKEIYEKEILPLGFEIVFAVDDDKDVIEMWRGMGITALDVGRDSAN